jgi:hypothetical protein
VRDLGEMRLPDGNSRQAAFDTPGSQFKCCLLAAWSSPCNGNLVPGSHLAVVPQGTSAISVLVVDSDGLLNVATLTIASDSWQGPVPVGNAGLVPGSYVSVQ